ncbi:MAG: PilZ domain-containing protein [Desulfobacteraceae bacterium]|nr:PilZ domain-containing protein [Desulfobacteraceae bacterium]
MILESANITRQLIGALLDLTDEQQSLILREIVKNDIPHYLIRLASELSGEEKKALLKTIEKYNFSIKKPEDTGILNLEEREHNRIKCTVDVECRANGESFQKQSMDISPGGMKITNPEALLHEQKIELSFSLPGYSPVFQLTGMIVQHAPDSIGIKFIDLPPKTETIMGSILAKMSE